MIGPRILRGRQESPLVAPPRYGKADLRLRQRFLHEQPLAQFKIDGKKKGLPCRTGVVHPTAHRTGVTKQTTHVVAESWP